MQYPIKPILDDINDSLKTNFTDQMIHNDKAWLTKTSNSQPAIVAMTYIIHHIAKTHFHMDLVKNSACILGHSLGEYTALCLSGVLPLSTTVRLVKLRAQLMEKINIAGYSIKILLFRGDYDKIYEICRKQGVLANINNYRQLVISGPNNKLNETVQQCQSITSVKVRDLSVNIPFHSSKISSIEADLEYFLKSERILQYSIPIISNLTGTMWKDISDTIAVNSQSVNWVGSMEYLTHLGVTSIVNLGPSNILFNLNQHFGYNNYLLDEFDDTTVNQLRQLTK